MKFGKLLIANGHLIPLSMEIECIARIKTEEPLLTLAITQYTIYFGGLSSTVYKHTFEDQITKFLTFNNPIRAICTDNDFLICCSYKNAIIMKNEKYIDIVENIETEIKGVDMKDMRIGIATRGCDVWLLDIKTNDENRYTERDDFERNCSVYNDLKVERNEREQSQCNNDKDRKDTRNTANIETMHASDTDYAEIYRIDVKSILHDHTHDVKGVKIHNDLVFTYGYDCCIKVYDNTLLENLVCDSTVWDLIFTDYIVASDNAGFLYYFDYDYKLVKKLKISNYPILKICKVKDTIAAITNRQCVAFIKDFEIVHIMKIGEYAINCIDYNEKSGTFGCVDDNGYLHVYRVKIE